MQTIFLAGLRVSTMIALAAPAIAQCSASWVLPNVGFGVAGTVETIGAWDPDGNGPRPPVAVLGGSFGQAGAFAASNVAIYDPAIQALFAPPDGPNGRVLAVVGMPNGDLIVGGEFTQAGATPGTGGIARWNGIGWSSLGGGVGGTVRSLLVDSAGGLVVGGTFPTAGANPLVNHVARWDGTAWSSYGSGMQQPAYPVLAAGVYSVVELPNGDLVAGGNFLQAGAASANTIARWNGSSWLRFDAGAVQSWQLTRQLFLRGNGTMLAVADVPSPAVAEWNGSSWVVPAGFPNDVRLLAETAGGNLLASTFGGLLVVAPASIFELQPSGWVSVATTTYRPADWFRAIAPLPQSGAADLIVGGSFSTISGQTAVNLARRVGGNWFGSGPVGPDAPVHAFASGADGTLYVGGRFTSIDGIPLSHIAAWNGSSWQALGSGVDNRVDSIAVAPDGDVYAAGLFQNAGGVPAPSLARWDGAAWHAVPGGPLGPVQIRLLRDGSLMVAGLGLMRFDGSAWQTILPPINRIYGFVELPDRRIAATGGLSNWNGAMGGPSRTAIWNGTSWQPLAYAHSVARDITVAPNGEVVLAAPFFNGDNIARWTGTGWQPLGAGLDMIPDTLTNLPGGEVVAGGIFSNSAGTSTPYLARFDGASWQPLGAGSPVFRAHFSPTGGLFVAGNSTAPQLLERVTTCPANAVVLPSGCAGGNAVALRATEWPYVAGVYRAFATGLSNNNLVLDVYGLGTSPVVLSTVLPSAAPGCTLLPVPDLYFFRSGSGLAVSELGIPNTPVAIGIMLWHQMIPVQLGARGNILGATTSNPLRLTVGSY